MSPALTVVVLVAVVVGVPAVFLAIGQLCAELLAVWRGEE